MPNNIIFLKMIGAIDQIFPHQILCERKQAQDNLFNDLEALNFFHFLSDFIPNESYVYTVAIFGKCAVEALDV